MYIYLFPAVCWGTENDSGYFSPLKGGQKPNTYVPFGNGAHACPGNELAKLEMLIMIYHLVNRFRYEYLSFEIIKLINDKLNLVRTQHIIKESIQ